MQHFAILLLKASRAVNTACILSAALILVMLVALVLAQTFSRYALAYPLAWTEEAGRYCMIWSGLLGATCAFKMHQDPRLASIEKVSGRRLSLIHLCDSLTAIVFCGVLLIASPGFVMRQAMRQSETMQANMGLVVAIIPIFAGVIVLHASARLVAVLAGVAPSIRPGAAQLTP